MNWETVITIAASSIAASISTYYFKKGNADKVQKNLSGNYVLRLPKMYKFIGILSIFIIIFFIILALLIQDEVLVILTIVMLAFFGGLGVPCLLAYKNYSVELNEKTITTFNWIGKKKVLFWSEIKDIKFSPISGYIKIFGNHKDVLKINHHLNGLNLLKSKIDEKTRWNAKDLKIPE